MSNYFGESCFKVSQCHVEGCNIDIASSGKSLVSIGNDDVFCQYSLSQQAKIDTISNRNCHQVCKIAIHPTNPQIIVVGTQNGFVLSIQTQNDSYEINNSRILYKSSNQSPQSYIRSLIFTSNGDYLLIATNQPCCIVYDMKKKRFFKQKLQNDTEIASIAVDHRNQYFCVIDFDGKANVYKIQSSLKNQKMELQEQNSDSQDPFAEQISNKQQTQLKLMSTYKIATSTLLKRFCSIQACFNFDEQQFLTETLYLPGQGTLQKVELNLPPASFSGMYSLCLNIYHSTEITHVMWLKNQKQGLILTISEIQAVLWLEKKQQKLMIFNLQALFGRPAISIKNICKRNISQQFNQGFALIGKSGNGEASSCNKVFDFKGFSQIQHQIMKKLDTEQINEVPQVNHFVEQTQKSKISKQKKQIRNQSIAAKLLPSYPQLSLSSCYQQYNNARFLFYNSVGCIIQRMDDQGSSVELQFHDKSKISRIKLPAQKHFEYFDLCSDTLVYGSTNTIYVQCQKYLKQNFSWEYEWQDIQGLSIGNQWIAVLNKSQIKIFDWTGNQLHTIEFDRKFVAIAAYEDLLAVVYHSSLPMWGVQSYKMILFQITTKTARCIKDTILPSKPNVALKWFGFSQEGVIFCQDQAENLRFYMFQKDQWLVTLSLDPLVQRLFIQHIQNYEIYGFRLQQKFPNEPKVMPRSLPRKIAFDLTNYRVEYLSTQQNQYIKKQKLSIFWLQHEKFRTIKWYKYKYSRKKQNRWYHRSESIKNQEQIRGAQAQMDIKLMDYLKKYIKINKNKEDKEIWKKVLFLCSSLAYYNQTRNKLAQILSQSQIRINLSKQSTSLTCQLETPEIPHCRKKKLSQLNRLQQMMGLPWVNLDKNDKIMEVQ